MATIKELREQAAKTLTEARSLNDAISDKSTAEQRAEAEQAVDKALTEVADIEARAERLSKLEAMEARATEAREAEERAQREARRPNMPAGEAATGGEMDYRTAFHEYVRSQIPDSEPLSAEARNVLRKGYAAVENRAQTTVNAAGGYSIPEMMLERVIVSMKAFGSMYDPTVTTEIMTTGGNPMPFPTVDDTAVTAGAHTEGATMTDDGGKDVTFGEKSLGAYAYDTEWIRVSKELADDSFIAMETFIGGLLGERLGRIANSLLTVGTGSSEATGIVTGSGLGITATGTAAITWDEIIDLEHSVDPAYRNGPSVGYMFNDSTLKAVRKLKDGDGNYLWQMGNVQGGIPATFNGRQYWVNQDMADMATGAKPMIFGDMSKYFVRKVGNPLVAAIQDKDFFPGFGMAGFIRFDGVLTDTGAVKHLIMS